MSEHIYIKVRGTLFEVKKSTLKKYPITLLGSITVDSQYYSHTDNCFHFDRNPELFNTILDYYLNGSIHLSNNFCGSLWKSELLFWKIPLKEISPCCFPKISMYEDNLKKREELKNVFKKPVITYHTSLAVVGRVRHKVWMFIDDPKSSIFARIFSLLFLLMVVVSSTTACLGTQPNIRKEVVNVTTLLWLSYITQTDLWINIDNPKEVMFFTTEEPTWLRRLNSSIMFIFCFESIVRFLASPSKCKFFKEWLNILDITLNITMIVRFVLDNAYVAEMTNTEELTYIYCFCACVQVLRLLKFFRVANQYSRLRIFFLALKASQQELILLLVTFVIIAWVFANLIFYTEVLEPDTFPTILDGLWWAVVSMTTVGYGDVYPVGPLGRCVGALCALSGLLVIAMPIAVIAEKFTDLSRLNGERESFDKLVNKQNGDLSITRVSPFDAPTKTKGQSVFKNQT